MCVCARRVRRIYKKKHYKISTAIIHTHTHSISASRRWHFNQTHSLSLFFQVSRAFHSRVLRTSDYNNCVGSQKKGETYIYQSSIYILFFPRQYNFILASLVKTANPSNIIFTALFKKWNKTNKFIKLSLSLCDWITPVNLLYYIFFSEYNYSISHCMRPRFGHLINCTSETIIINK